jgi:hypothetical protein
MQGAACRVTFTCTWINMAVSDDICICIWYMIFDMICKEFPHREVIFSKSEQNFAGRSYRVSYQFM